MDRINAIWNHPLYQQNLSELLNLESDRIFCRHTPEHFLDVARLTWIYILEERLDFSREIVYSAALLHDIGRARQYIDGTPHDEAGACIANTILTDLAFTEEEKSLIITAISEHRSSGTQTGIFSRRLYKADK